MSMIINPYQVSGPPFSCATPIQGLNTDYGTGTINFSYAPFYGLYDFGETANILLQSQVGVGKQITGLGCFFSGFTTPYTFTNVEIWVGHTTNNEFPVGVTVGYPTMTITNLTQCYSGPFSITTNNAWKTENFNLSNFCYNGTNNLIVIFKNFDGDWDPGYGFSRHTFTALEPVGSRFRQVNVEQDTTYPPNGTAFARNQYYNNIRLLY